MSSASFYGQVADYDVVRKINHGCEGAVYLVRCKCPRITDPGKLYALKMMFNIFELGSMTQVGALLRTALSWCCERALWMRESVSTLADTCLSKRKN